MDLIDQKRVKKDSGSTHGKLDKDEPGTKLKKRSKVLVEVNMCFKLCKYDNLCDLSSLEYIILINLFSLEHIL